MQFIVRAVPIADEQRLPVLLDRVLESEDLLVEARERTAKLELERAALIGQQEELARINADYQLHAAQLEASATEKNEHLAELLLHVAQLESSIAERNEHVSQLESALSDVAERNELVSQLESALSENQERIVQLESSVTERDELVSQLELALSERQERIVQLELDATIAETLMDFAGGQISYLREVEKDYRDVVADFEKYTARELNEIRSETHQVNELTKAIQRSPFWSLKMAVRRLYRFGRD